MLILVPMEINEFNYYFKVRSVKDVVLTLGAIYKNLSYCKIDKTRISQIFNLTSQDIKDENYLNNINRKVNIVNDAQQENLNIMCKQLQKKWDNYRKEYLAVISNIFDIKINLNLTTNTFCYLHMLPINEVDLKDNIIYLDCNKNVDEVFKSFIIMLTKLILINRWNSVNNWNFNDEFDIRNKVWMFVELAIDAIFANTPLSKICDKPTYKYLYSLKVKGVNVLEHFRIIHKTLAIDDFFTEVYMFVHINHDKLLQFKNYLY